MSIDHFKIDSPLKQISPLSGFNNPITVFANVDFPLPLWPSSPNNSPFLNSTETSSQKLSDVLIELKNLLKPNPILITGYDQFDLLAKEAAFKKAAEMARADFSKGTYHLLAYGLSSIAISPSEKFLRIKYQIYM